ncbi:unannotated protein [freshwater metagenome]|uniref:Unannotated protein n=1 Tax=freshwater metagenome TaxID=449393 RepID=A0A6J6YF15_9ZZZZ
MVHPIEATAYATPKPNIDQNVWLRCLPAPNCDVANGGFHPANMKQPRITRAMPMPNAAYLALSWMTDVNARLTAPTMTNTEMKPADVAALTSSAR